MVNKTMSLSSECVLYVLIQPTSLKLEATRPAPPTAEAVRRSLPPAPAPPGAPASRDEPPPAKRRRGDEAGAPAPADQKRERDEAAQAPRRPTGRHSLRNKENFAILTSLNRRCPGSVRVRLSGAAAPLEMVAAARRAAARSSTDTLVSARGKTRAKDQHRY